jgi:hypothetical protein
MLSFDHFRDRRRMYQPRTPASALRAVSEGFAEVEELVYQGTSIKPLVEEPYDLMELQRILSRRELDLGTNLLLVRIFTHLLADPDPERALFAAEGITTVETRYARQIDEIKKTLAAGDDPLSRLELAGLYYELAMLNEKSPSIRSFYLREAFLNVRSEVSGTSLPLALLAVTVRILAALGLNKQAESVLRRAKERVDPEVLFMRAEVAFMQRDYRAVSVIARHLSKDYNRLREGIRATIDQWCGKHEAAEEKTAGTGDGT